MNYDSQENRTQEAYYYVGDQRIPLFPDPQVLAVRIDSAARQDPDWLSPAILDMLHKAELVTYLHQEGLNSSNYRRPEDG